jgi:hypothetical protein
MPVDSIEAISWQYSDHQSALPEGSTSPPLRLVAAGFTSAAALLA